MRQNGLLTKIIRTLGSQMATGWEGESRSKARALVRVFCVPEYKDGRDSGQSQEVGLWQEGIITLGV